MKLALLPLSNAERSRLLSVDLVRKRALERLYERLAVVEDLISSLEDYERASQGRRAKCIEFTVAPRYSSDYVQSQI
jgi:hypothetical protein